MNIEELREYCLSKPHTTEGFPFDSETLVMKVGGKMYALMGLENHPPRINLKCDPENAIALREEYSCVLPGYHMSKVHWNTVIVDGSVPDKLVQQWIDESYTLVLNSLPKKLQAEIVGK